MAPIIQTYNLTKRFGKLVAVDHVNFSVEEGEIFGLLGPNGAGKTTIINMLTTLLKPTEGTAKILDYDIVKDESMVRRVIGLVPQELTVDEDLTGRENMILHARLYHLDREVIKKRVDEVLSLVGLLEFADKKVETYSGGMRKRLELAEGLIHHPKVLFLDEPTLGLDVQTRAVIWDYIKQLRKDHNMTIFLTTHYMDEADMLCDRVAIVDYGRIKVIDSPSKLKDGLGGDIIELDLVDEVEDKVKESITSIISNIPHVKEVKRDRNHYRIKVVKGEETLPIVIKDLAGRGLRIDRVSLVKPTLDQVYLEYTGRSLREVEGSSEDVWRLRMTLRRVRT
ncbi:MAG: ATP-binding cassette domain-containing protein [Nitrososphaerota archaeon]|nr:ATP-binding cassette domain-containing protein [Nitrososphaerales archaeon]MDW8044470.1 ATP-binding cassette domain-containing protein [Nitrososphaerota archaeon]